MIIQKQPKQELVGQFCCCSGNKNKGEKCNRGSSLTGYVGYTKAGKTLHIRSLDSLEAHIQGPVKRDVGG